MSRACQYHCPLVIVISHCRDQTARSLHQGQHGRQLAEREDQPGNFLSRHTQSAHSDSSDSSSSPSFPSSPSSPGCLWLEPVVGVLEVLGDRDHRQHGEEQEVRGQHGGLLWSVVPLSPAALSDQENPGEMKCNLFTL